MKSTSPPAPAKRAAVLSTAFAAALLAASCRSRAVDADLAASCATLCASEPANFVATATERCSSWLSALRAAAADYDCTPQFAAFFACQRRGPVGDFRHCVTNADACADAYEAIFACARTRVPYNDCDAASDRVSDCLGQARRAPPLHDAMCDGDPFARCVANCHDDADCDAIAAFYVRDEPGTSLGACILSCEPPKL
jgi:hypothetical protein